MNSWIAAVLNSLWQAFAMAAFVWGALKFTPRVNAATRHAVWWAVLGVVVVLPAASVLIEKGRGTGRLIVPPARFERIAEPVPDGPAAFVPMPPVRTHLAVPIEVRAGAWPVVLPLVWLAVLLFQMARVAWSYRHVRGLKHRAAPADPALRRSFDAWMLSCGVGRP